MSESVLTKTKTIAYWADGFWMENVEEAEVADKYNSFGDMKHKLLDVPENATKDEITEYIGQAIEALEPKTVINQTAPGFTIITREEDGIILDLKKNEPDH